MGEQKYQPQVHYDIKVLAKSLKLASIDVQKTPNKDFEIQWYRSSGPVDVFCWREKKKLVKHQVNLYGQIVEWNVIDGVRTGFINEDDMEEVDTAEIITFDKSPNDFVVEQVLELLKEITVIEGPIIEQMMKHYGQPSPWQSWGLVRFFKALKFKYRK